MAPAARRSLLVRLCDFRKSSLQETYFPEGPKVPLDNNLFATSYRVATQILRPRRRHRPSGRLNDANLRSARPAFQPQNRPQRGFLPLFVSIHVVLDYVTSVRLEHFWTSSNRWFYSAQTASALHFDFVRAPCFALRRTRRTARRDRWLPPLSERR